jgi:excisionase family DNA binding protein
LSTPAKGDVTERRLLTARELGQLLGFSAATIVDWSEAGKLPAFKVGGRLRFRLSEIEAWLEEQRLEQTPRREPGEVL